MERSMKELVAEFADQLRKGLKIGVESDLKGQRNNIRNVLITGLGGSGIGGTIASQVLESNISVPVLVNKDYFLPEFVNENTLVIVSSYSGNTEETLNAMNIALDKGAAVACVSSGGKVTELAETNGLDHIVLPGGMPPRACLAYSFPQLFVILEHYGLVGGMYLKDISNAIDLIEREEEHIRSEAYYIAEKLFNKIPVIYSQANYEGVCIRLRQQINENSKMLCWHHVLPEMNHNELVGWTIPNNKIAVLILRNETDFDRTQARMDLTKEIVSKYTPHIFEIYSKGDSILERVLYLIHFGDWVSWYLSELRGIDATEVNVIDYLKGELSKV